MSKLVSTVVPLGAPATALLCLCLGLRREVAFASLLFALVLSRVTTDDNMAVPSLSPHVKQSGVPWSHLFLVPASASHIT